MLNSLGGRVAPLLGGSSTPPKRKGNVGVGWKPVGDLRDPQSSSSCPFSEGTPERFIGLSHEVRP